jgi:hypothetical protein
MLKVHLFGAPSISDLVEHDLDHLGVGACHPSHAMVVKLDLRDYSG